MSYLNWHVGMKVVCVDARPNGDPRPVLREGDVYTIRWIGAWNWQGDDLGCYGLNSIGVRLVGVRRPQGSKDIPLAAARFRPAQPRKTSIEVFTRILRNPHVRIREDA